MLRVSSANHGENERKNTFVRCQQGTGVVPAHRGLRSASTLVSRRSERGPAGILKPPKSIPSFCLPSRPQTPELKSQLLLCSSEYAQRPIVCRRVVQAHFAGQCSSILMRRRIAEKIGQVPLTPYGVTHSICQRPPSIPHSFPVETSWQKSCTATIWSRGVSLRRAVCAKRK